MGGFGCPFGWGLGRSEKKTTATAKTEADPYGMTNKKDNGKSKSKNNSNGLAEVVGGFGG
jgi:hypothetical protein